MAAGSLPRSRVSSGAIGANDGLRNTHHVHPTAAATAPVAVSSAPASAAMARGPVASPPTTPTKPTMAANSSRLYKRLLGLHPLGEAGSLPRSGVRSGTMGANDGLRNTSPIHPAAAATTPVSSAANTPGPAASTRGPVASTSATSDPVDAASPASSTAKATFSAKVTPIGASDHDSVDSTAFTDNACGAQESDAAALAKLRAQTTADCSMPKPDLQMIGISESGPFFTQLQGIRNQGGTCYLNSIVQTLFHLPLFQEIICQTEDIPQGSAAFALKALFYQLKHSDQPVYTYELTTSLGWSRNIHEDVVEKFEELLQELMMIPCLKNVIEEIFGGSIRQTDTSSCIKTEHTFYVLRLKVLDCRSVKESFEEIVREELTASNAVYTADPNHFQETTEIPLIGHLPPVLVLQLGRFVEITGEECRKLNDRYEFPSELDLDIKGLSVGSDKYINKIYTLHSVHVHSGDTRGGHNFVFIRPSLLNEWYKFDDHMVSKATEDMALREQYGGQEGPSAYMLVYIRKTEKDFVSTSESRVTSHVQINIEDLLDESKEQPPQSKLDGVSEFLVSEYAKFKSYVGCCLSSEYLYSIRVFGSRYLNFGVVVNNLLAYSGFHVVLLGLDLLIESRLKDRIFISMWEGLCWLIAVTLHVWVIRWINSMSHMIGMVPDMRASPVYQLEAILDQELSVGKIGNPISYVREFRIKIKKLVDAIKKDARFEDIMLFLLAMTRWIFAVLKEITSEKIGRGFLGQVLAHVGAMSIELIGSFAAYRYIHKKNGAWFSLEWLL